MGMIRLKERRDPAIIISELSEVISEIEERTLNAICVNVKFLDIPYKNLCEKGMSLFGELKGD